MKTHSVFHLRVRKITESVGVHRIALLLTFILCVVFFCGSLTYASSSVSQREGYIPYTLPWDDLPIDLSFLYEEEKPAGKHGFLQVVEDRFVFQDGTAAKFWGTNFNSAQNFPSHTHSEKVARRLAKIGVNIVRFHQLDAEWSTPNIFQFSKGRNKDNTLTLDPESLDRLDYLIHCLKKEGIYVYMDLLTYRRFRSGDGIEAAEQLGDAAKPYSTFSRKLIDPQKQFNFDLWNHMNPYTKLAYKDEPAIVLVEITNENDLFSQEVTVEPYKAELKLLYKDWAAAEGIEVDQDNVEFDRSKQVFQRFFREVTKKYYTEMIQHLRETGVKIPIAGTNWVRGVAHLEAQNVADFTDGHSYWYSWKWKATEKAFQNDPMTGSIRNMLTGLTFNRVAGKPYFVSEWDNPWPNEWRAESSLLMAAVGAFQGWGGFCIHTYRYSRDEDVEMIGKPITSDAIGGVYYRGGVFDTFNDPAKFGLFYHAALIMRRGDVRGATTTLNVVLEDQTSRSRMKALQLTPEKHRVEMVLPGMVSTGATIVSPEEVVFDAEKGEVFSDTGELYRSFEKKFGWIDTPKTKAAYGFLGKEGTLALQDLKINVTTDFATVALSTLTDEPINSSSNMLLTAVGRADNTNSRYNEDHTQQLEVGHGPIQVQIIAATVKIKTDKKDLRVFAINPQGFIIGYIPSEYRDGVFEFEIGGIYPSMYYLIQSI
jgi:hypothetical protein